MFTMLLDSKCAHFLHITQSDEMFKSLFKVIFLHTSVRLAAGRLHYKLICSDLKLNNQIYLTSRQRHRENARLRDDFFK